MKETRPGDEDQRVEGRGRDLLAASCLAGRGLTEKKETVESLNARYPTIHRVCIRTNASMPPRELRITIYLCEATYGMSATSRVTGRATIMMSLFVKLYLNVLPRQSFVRLEQWAGRCYCIFIRYQKVVRLHSVTRFWASETHEVLQLQRSRVS